MYSPTVCLRANVYTDLRAKACFYTSSFSVYRNGRKALKREADIISQSFSFSCIYDTIYTRGLIGFSNTNNTVYTTELQGRQTQPRDVYDVVTETIMEIMRRNLQRTQEAELTTTGGQPNDRQGERGTQSL